MTESESVALPLGDTPIYTKVLTWVKKMAPRVGLEPTTDRLTADCSTDWAIEEWKWSGKRDSNSRPPPWQGGALPLSYFRISQQKLFYTVNDILSSSFLTWLHSKCLVPDCLIMIPKNLVPCQHFCKKNYTNFLQKYRLTVLSEPIRFNTI